MGTKLANLLLFLLLLLLGRLLPLVTLGRLLDLFRVFPELQQDLVVGIRSQASVAPLDALDPPFQLKTTNTSRWLFQEVCQGMKFLRGSASDKFLLVLKLGA